MSNKCAHCGAQLEEHTLVCILCGAEKQRTADAQEIAPEAAQPTPEMFIARKASEEANLSGIGGWLVFTAIGLILAPFLNLFALATDGRLLFNPGARDYLMNHAGLYLLIVFEVISNLVFLLYCTGLNVLFYAKKKAFPVAMIVFLAANVLVISIDHISVAQLALPEKPTQLIRALISAAIWIPYFMRSRRVALTFVR
jgi:hypothetical protein